MSERGKLKGGKLRTIAAVDRRVKALRLRRQGLTYEQIAARLGYAGRASAFKAISTALRETLQEPADELRQLELERLDDLHCVLWPRAIAGNLRAVDGVLALMRRRAKLLGLDAPRETAVDVEVSLRRLAVIAGEEIGIDPALVWAEATALLRKLEQGHA
jgi:hypothetical protein